MVDSSTEKIIAFYYTYKIVFLNKKYNDKKNNGNVA